MKRFFQRLTSRARRCEFDRAATERQPAVLPDSARAAFVAALGQRFLLENDRRLVGLRQAEGPHDGIRLHLRSAINDLQAGWWQTPAVRAYAETAIELEELEVISTQEIGSVGRSLINRIDAALNEIEDFRLFLNAFGSETVPRLLGELLLQFALASRWQIVTYTAVDREQAEAAARCSGEASARVAQIEQQLDEMNIVYDTPPPTPEEVIEAAIGRQPTRGAAGYHQLMQGFGNDPAELAQLTVSQLTHMIRASEFPDEVGATWLAQACSLLLLSHPLLAHRAANLGLRSFRQAAASNAEAVAELLRRFHHAEVGRITSRARRAEELIGEFHETHDANVLLRAYTTLLEGPLRSYTSTLLNLWVIEDGLPLPPKAGRPLLGALEDRLRSSGRELAFLLTRGISREVRNAVAHEDVVRTAAGELAIIQDDGSFAPIDIQTVYDDFASLHSALRGLDVAFGIAQWLLGDATDFNPRSIHRTTESLEGLAGQAAAAITGGWITDWQAANEKLHITLDGIGGPMMPIQVLSFVASLDPHMPEEIAQIEVLSVNGLPLYSGSRLPFDLFSD